MTESTYPTPPAIEDWNRLLEGRIAVVSGGAGGIGGAISALFAQHGALVEFIDIDAEEIGAITGREVFVELRRRLTR